MRRFNFISLFSFSIQIIGDAKCRFWGPIVIFFIFVLFKGPKVHRDNRSKEILDVENHPEKHRNDLLLQEILQNRKETRFQDGPVFRKINQKKQGFFQRNFNHFYSFLGVGCVFFFVGVPIWGFLIQPMITSTKKAKQPEKLTKKDPEQVLEDIINEEYLREHGLPWTQHTDKES